MARFTKVEVHFGPEEGVRRVVVRPGRGVDAIFLDTSAIPEGMTPRKVSSVPPGLTVEGQLTGGELIDGPGVCYLVNGELLCW